MRLDPHKAYAKRFTAVRDSDGVGSAQEVLSDRHNLTAVADSDRAIVAVGVVVARLLVVLKPLHEREQI